MKRAESFEDMVRVFTPFPLDGDNYTDFYVDTSHERSMNNASKEIVNSFRIGIDPYMKVLFMGHKGCGKSTELKNISEQLKDKYRIVNFSIANEVELQGIVYIDVIFVIMERIFSYAEKEEINIKQEVLEELYRYWNQEKFVENIKTEGYDISAGAEGKLGFLKRISMNFKGILKSGNESKTIIRGLIEPRLNVLLSMINDMLTDINAQLIKQEGKELLIIIEDMDKLDMEEARNIFVLHRRPLVSMQVKMLFSFPIYMVYTSEFSMLKDDFSKCVLYSMIKVNNSDYSRYEPGIQILKKIVERRMKLDLIQNDALDYMVLKSGGAIRDLFNMLSQAALYQLDKDEPADIISKDTAVLVVAALKSEYERNITSKKQYEMLIQIYNDPHPTNTDETLSELLKTLSVMEYNGERWCGVHPVLTDFLREKGAIECKDGA